MAAAEAAVPSLVALLAERFAAEPREPAPPAPPRAPSLAEQPIRRHAPDLRTDHGRALLVCGLWLRGAFVGASLVATAVVQLATSAVDPLYAVLLGAAGAWAAVWAWRRMEAAVDRADALVTAPVATTPAQPAAVG
jgi:hypothetical protein